MNPAELPRVIHLLGGRKALDYCDDNLALTNVKLGKSLLVPRTSYTGVFGQLEQLGFTCIGCEFLDSPECIRYGLPGTFLTLLPGRKWLEHSITTPWNNSAHQFRNSEDFKSASSIAKLTTYLKLISLRLKELSNAYNDALQGHLALSPNNPIDDSLHSSVWSLGIDASLHSFFADAASLNDAIAEVTWNVYLNKRQEKRVTKMKSLISATKDTNDNIIKKIRDEYKNGWIFSLSMFRNEILHKAPISNYFGNTSFQSRGLTLQGYDDQIPYVHFPFSTIDMKFVESSQKIIDVNNEEDQKAEIKRSFEFANNSTDALKFCYWITVQIASLCKLLLGECTLDVSLPILSENDLA